MVRGPRILVVDDHVEIRRMTQARLQDDGCHVTVAGNGRETPLAQWQVDRVAHARTILRGTRVRPPEPAQETCCVDGVVGWRLDAGARELQAPDGTPVTLPAREFPLRLACLSHPGCPLSRNRLADAVPGGRPGARRRRRAPRAAAVPAGRAAVRRLRPDRRHAANTAAAPRAGSR